MISLESQTFFDFVGNEIQIGDICVTTSSQYRELIKVEVVRLTECTVWVTKVQPDSLYDKSKEFKRIPSQIIKAVF